MSATTRTQHAIEDPTAALQARPVGDGARDGGLRELGPGRWLLWGDRACELGPGVTHLGRATGMGVRLDDETVSARHAIIVARTIGLRILDDGSTNGTFVNGRRVDEAELRDGDVVVLGRVVLTYRDLRA